MKCTKGKFAILSAYAPTNSYPYEEQQNFYKELAQFYQSISVHGPKYIMGDINARIYDRFSGEDSIIGPYFVANSPPKIFDSSWNRFLLLEFCTSHQLQISNTFVEQPLEQRVTYYDIGGQPMENCANGKFSQ
eukprot:8460108-Karenia_brevis.AAC.1